MSKIGWGKPRIIVKNITKAGSFRELPTPVEDTFDVSTEKGDKLEAKIEGGDYEDVRYKKNGMTITMDIRVAKGRKKPFNDVDGVIQDEFELYVVPEDPTVPAGLHVQRACVSAELKDTAADGMTYTYTIEPLKPASGKTVEVGTVTVTESSGLISACSIVELAAETDEESSSN